MHGCSLGYDPAVREPFPVETPHFVDAPPAATIVNPAFLPPVGQQGTTLTEGSPGSCCAWATVYGLATFTAASAGRVDPRQPSGQASPAQIYIQALLRLKTAPGTCADTKSGDYIAILQAGGTANMADAPYLPDCPSLWFSYSSAPAKSEAAFRIGEVATVDTADLASLKQVLASGRVLSYGTRLFTDFSTYSGGASPYCGNGEIITSPTTGKAAGHCMLIVGYNTATNALLIQNSQGTVWGIGGFMWIAYPTFQFLSQGQALFVKD